jgi:hypothetical protein
MWIAPSVSVVGHQAMEFVWKTSSVSTGGGSDMFVHVLHTHYRCVFKLV